MRKEVTNAVRERIMVINARFQEIISDTTGNNDKESKDICQEYWNIRTEYNLFDRTFDENDKMGVVDILGNVVVPALYKDYSELYNYTIHTRLPIPAKDFNNKYALVTSDGKGTPLCDFEYDHISFMRGSDKFFVSAKKVGERMLSGVIDSNGKVIVPCEMDVVHYVSNNIACMVKDGKIGILTMNGDFFAPVYDEVEEHNDFLTVCKDGAWGYLSTEGEFIDMSDEDRIDEVILLRLIDC